MSNHIKDPWTVSDDGSTIIAADGFPVAVVDEFPVLPNWAELGIGHWSEAPGKASIERDEEEVLATAHLIASAPDMLSVLEKVVASGWLPFEFAQPARAVIAKVKGE
jgi:hypothetical protein